MNDKLHTEHDVGYKSLLRHKKTFVEFLRDFVKKDWVNEVKEENLVLIDKEFILEDFKEEEADIVYKVNIDGEDIIFYILLELQSKVDFSMPIRLFMYMSEIWRDELKNTDKNDLKRKGFKLPAIVPMIVYNGSNNWTAPRSFKEVLSGYELFDDFVIDYKYMLYDINRMNGQELLEISTLISSVFSLDQSEIDDEEIIRRLKVIGKVLNRKSSNEQLKLFKNWIIGILRNRYSDEAGEEFIDILNKASEKEMEDMVNNLGDNLEKSINRKVKDAKKEGHKEVAIRLLRMGMAIDVICEATELDKVTVEELQKSISH